MKNNISVLRIASTFCLSGFMLFGCSDDNAGSSEQAPESGFSIGATEVNTRGGVGDLYWPNLYIDVAAHGSGQPARLFIDSASSTTGICPGQTTNAEPTGRSCCNVYGNVGAQEGFSGLQHVGELTMGSGSDTISVMDQSFCMMQLEDMWSCLPDRNGEALDGIIGFGPYAAGNGVWDRPPVSMSEMEDSGIVDSCLGFGAPADRPTPFVLSLFNEFEKGQYGLYWSGEFGDSTGRLYVGDEATSNEHFINRNVQFARMPNSQAEPSLWNLYIVKYRLTLTQVGDGSTSSVDVAGPPGQVDSTDAAEKVLVNPGMDTGQPMVYVPQDVYEAGISLIGSLTPDDYELQLDIELLGVDGGENVILSLDLKEFQAKNRIEVSSGPPSLGLYLMYVYPYIVFDLENNRIGFGS